MADPPTDTPGPRFDPVTIWRTLRKHWPTSLATALVVSLVVVFYTLGQTKIYQASATLLIDPNPPKPLGKSVEMVVETGTGSYWGNKEYYETQYKILQSRQVTLAAVQQLGLHRDGPFLQNLPAGKSGPTMEVPAEQAAAVLQGRLRVDPIKDSRLAYVRLEDADPARAQRILTVVIDAYIEQNLEYASSSATSAVEWLREQLDKLKDDLETSERALHKYKRDKNILSLDLDAQSNMLREEMSRLNQELTSVRAKREQVSAQREELLKIKPEDPTSFPAHELLASPMIQSLRQRYEDAVREKASLMGSGKGTGYPDVTAAEARAATTRTALMAEVRNVQKAVDREFSAVKRQEAGLSSLFEASKRRALELNLLEVDYNRLRRSRDNNEKLFSLVLERTKESDLARMMRVNNVRVIERSSASASPVRPRVGLNIGLGIIAGLVLGVAAALGRALLDRTVKTPDDIETDLGATFLGLLPEKAAKHSYAPYGRRNRRRALETPDDLVVHKHPTSGFAEAARAVRTNLMFMAPDRPFRVLLVTSPAPSEGKTTVAVSIAIAIAQAGQRVALVDCDLRRPRVHRVFSASSDTGVTTMMMEDGPAVGIETEVANLSVIPSGPLPPNPAEIFHSERFKKFLNRVLESYDRVVIDSPPVVTVTDPTVLSTMVDGVVLVLRAFSTQKDSARHAIRALRDVGGNLVGVVLNAVNLDRHEYKYHYYYYRRDDYGYTQRPEDKPSVGTEDQSAP